MNIYEDFNACLQKKKYSCNWTAEQELFFKKTWPIRQESLRFEIEKYRKQKKRIFVCAGAAHFFPRRGKDLSILFEDLIKDKFCLAIRNIEQNATYYSFDQITKKISNLCGD